MVLILNVTVTNSWKYCSSHEYNDATMAGSTVPGYDNDAFKIMKDPEAASKTTALPGYRTVMPLKATHVSQD